MEIFKIYIELSQINELVTANKTIRMVAFSGSCEGKYFNGTILPQGVDTQIINQDGSGTLSARYMLKGVDADNKTCSIFIENNAVIGDKDGLTKPCIFTDSKRLKWLEQADLVGKMESQDGKLVICISENS